MFIETSIVYLFLGLALGYVARSLQLAYAKWSHLKEVQNQFATTKAAAIAAKEFEARKLHPEQANAKK